MQIYAHANIYTYVYGRFHQNLLQSRRIQFLLFLLISLSTLACSQILIIILVHCDVVFLKWSDLCMSDIFFELVLSNDEKKSDEIINKS